MSQPSAGTEPGIRTLYLVLSSHLDIGFTAPADVVADQYKPNIDRAIAQLDRHPDLVWTIEQVWLLEQWLKRTSDPAALTHAIDLVRAGRLALTAGFAGEHSGLMTAAEMAHFFYPAAELRQRYGVSAATVMQNDIPGYSWAYPGIFSRAGMKYFLTGVNLTFGGGTTIARGHNPFYWEGADGSRILTWINHDSYVEGLEVYRFQDGLDEARVAAGVRRYTDAGYPYDAILVQHAFDNWDIDQLGAVKLLEQIRAWNATGRTPRIVVSGPEAFFRHIEERYPNTFHTYRGDWSGLWEQVKWSSPIGSALARRAKPQLYTGETLAAANALVGPAAFPTEQVDGLYREVLGFDEHSVGGVAPWPDYFTDEQTQHENALRYAEQLHLAAGCAALQEDQWAQLAPALAGDKPGVVVFNALSWPHGGPTRVTLPTGSPAQPALRDEASAMLYPLQAAADGAWLFLAPEIPALGYRRFTLEPWPDNAAARQEVAAGPYSLENAWFRVEVDPRTGALTSVWDRRGGRELVNAARDAALGFNSLAHGPHGGDFGHRTCEPIPAGAVTVTGGAGPLAAWLDVTRAGTPCVYTRLTAYAGQPWIEITNVVDRSCLPEPVAGQPSQFYYFAYPFAFDPDGLHLHVETAAGFLDPAHDLLPGAHGRGWSIQHVVGLSGRDGYGAMLAACEPYLIFLGDVNGAGPFEPPPSATLFSGAMALTYFGRSKDKGWVRLVAGEPGGPPRHSFTYRLGSHAAFDPVVATRFGWEAVAGLLAATIQAGARQASPAGSILSLDPANVVLAEIKGASFGDARDLIVRVQEVGGQPTTATLRTAFPVERAWLADLLEAPQAALDAPQPLRVPVEARSLVTVRLQIRPGLAMPAGQERRTA